MILKDKKALIIFIVILVIQCALLIHWQGYRGGYYIDELYSFGYAKNFAKDSTSYITDTDLWRYNVWLDADTLASQMKVTDKDSLFSLPASESIHLLVSKRTYMGLLNMAVAGADSFKDYCRRALVLNIIFFIVSELLLAYCMTILTSSKGIAILSVVMFGFSSIMMGMCEYVRFYMFAIMLLLLVVLFQLKMWTEDRIWKFFLYEIIAFVSAYYGLMHSEFFMVICGTLFPLFFIGMLFRKRFLKAMIYALPLGIGVYRYVYLRTDLIYAALHLSDYARPGHGKVGVATNLINITAERSIRCLRIIRDCMINKWFGNRLLLIVFAVFFIICIVLIIKEKKKSDNQDKTQNHFPGFVIILFLTAVVGVFFNVLAALSVDRYQVFNIVLLMIVFWACAGAVYNRLHDNRIIATFAAITAVCAILCQQAESMPFLYANKKASVDKIEQYKEMDYIIYEINKDRHAVYDCISHCPEGRKLYAPSPFMEVSLAQIEPPEKFMAWCTNAQAIDKMLRSLDGSGYSARLVGSTHLNYVFICTKDQ